MLRMHNLHGTKPPPSEGSEEEEEEEDEEDEEERKPQLELAMVPHYGGINRVRVSWLGEEPVAGVWSEKGQVEVFALRRLLQAVDDSQALATFLRDEQARVKPIFAFAGHMGEGFALDWSPRVSGRLLTGDCQKNIHLWTPTDGGSWHVDQRPFVGHTRSVEDLQWSPTEDTVRAGWGAGTWACGGPRGGALVEPYSRRAVRARPGSPRGVGLRCSEPRPPFFPQSGSPVATFKQHVAPVTSVEWHPQDSGVFAASQPSNHRARFDAGDPSRGKTWFGPGCPLPPAPTCARTCWPVSQVGLVWPVSLWIFCELWHLA
uniref:Glutamate-rich WD repeat-containing protein 1 n=1 Tax=Ursus maritimus TaxID=29073 RepID=A0A452SXT5_URSMA